VFHQAQFGTGLAGRENFSAEVADDARGLLHAGVIGTCGLRPVESPAPVTAQLMKTSWFIQDTPIADRLED
jgi:hypothetical protein